MRNRTRHRSDYSLESLANLLQYRLERKDHRIKECAKAFIVRNNPKKTTKNPKNTFEFINAERIRK